MRTRLILLVLLAVIPAVALVVYFDAVHRHEVLVASQHDALGHARQVAAEYSLLGQQINALLSVLAELPSVGRADPKSCPATLARLLARNTYLANIGVIGPRGYLVCSATPHTAPVYLGDRAYYRSVLASHSSTAGTLQVGRVVRVPMVVFAAPVRQHGHSVVYASLRLSSLGRMAAAAALPRHSSLTVLDAAGHIIARYPHGKRWIGKRAPAMARVIKAYKAAPTRTVLAEDLDGTQRMFAVYVPGSGALSGVSVLVGFAVSELSAASRQLLLQNLVLIAIATLLLLSIGWWGSEHLILKRVRRLADTARRLEGGQFDARAHIDGRDEIALLGRTFDRMADTLVARNRALAGRAQRIERLNRVYRVLTSINGAILRIRDRDTLLQEACRIAVEIGGFRTAWIGLIDEDTRLSRLIAHAGAGRSVLEAVTVSVDENLAEGHGTVGSAMRENRPVICDDVATDPAIAPWRDVMLSLGCRSIASFPLSVRRHVIGHLTIYSAECRYFDEDEIRLYDELAADTSLGIEHIDAEVQRDFLAYHDPATELPNRALFDDRLSQVILRAQEKGICPAVIVLEVPEITVLSDQFGYNAADAAACALTPYLRSMINDGDTLARLATHTFAVAAVTEMRDRADVAAVTARLLSLFPKTLDVVGRPCTFTVRMGVAVHSPAIGDGGALIRSAELALRSADPATGAVAYYSPGLDALVQERHRIDQALQHAIVNHEFELVYQPIMAISTGKIIGAEALLRWHSATLGSISPGVFIPIAERSALIRDIGRWTLDCAIQQAVAWKRAGLRLGTLSINVSAQQLRQRDFVDKVSELLASHGWDAEGAPLAVELTETAVMQDVDWAVKTLTALRELGVRIYLDDFGTGYSSLSYLHRLPIDTLKFDLSFIRGLPSDDSCVALTRAMISLAQRLSIQTVAEGVEQQAQFDMLREMGCDAAQGYLISRPAAAAGFERFIIAKSTPRSRR